MFFSEHSVYDAFGRRVCVCVSVRAVTWKLLQIICFLFVSYVNWRNLSNKFACQGHRSKSKVMFLRVQIHSVRLWAILLRVVRFPSWCLHFLVIKFFGTDGPLSRNNWLPLGGYRDFIFTDDYSTTTHSLDGATSPQRSCRGTRYLWVLSSYLN